MKERFTVYGDCVTDNLTGLMWAKNANFIGRADWQEAIDYVASLNSEGGLGGYTDWHLPNVNELKSLINMGESHPAAWLNSQGFTNVQAGFYWSATTYAGYMGSAWIVGMHDGGGHSSYKTSRHCVWPVRSE